MNMIISLSLFDLIVGLVLIIAVTAYVSADIQRSLTKGKWRRKLAAYRDYAAVIVLILGGAWGGHEIALMLGANHFAVVGTIIGLMLGVASANLAVTIMKKWRHDILHQVWLLFVGKASAALDYDKSAQARVTA